MNLVRKMLALTLLLAVVPGVVLAESTIMVELGSKAAKTAMSELKFQKGDSNVLALTDAGHAIVDGQTTQEALKGIAEETGFSEADSNLFQVLRPNFKPLCSISSTRLPAKPCSCRWMENRSISLWMSSKP